MSKWLSLGVMATALLAAATLLHQPAQAQEPAEKTLTGCLNSADGDDGGFVLTVKEGEQKGQKVMVTGSADLEKHSQNHTVNLTGTMKQEEGEQVFNVTKVEHVAPTCEAATE